MDTISNMANTAAKAVWGTCESKEEPVSGRIGDVSHGEPYDAGNIESGESTGVEATNGKPAATTGQSTAAATVHTSNPPTATPTTSSTGTETSPEKTKDSSVQKGDHSRGQGDVKPPPDPEAAAADAQSGAIDFEGPGPRPIDQVAREHGGDAGSGGSTTSRRSEGPGGASAPRGDAEEGPQTKSQGEGTGEKYVKSSGLRADGGNFDAANPGAGREADRLLEEKGVHKEESGNTATAIPDTANAKKTNHASHGNHTTQNSGAKESMKLGQKLKSKLHMGHGHSA